VYDGTFTASGQSLPHAADVPLLWNRAFAAHEAVFHDWVGDQEPALGAEAVVRVYQDEHLAQQIVPA